MWRKIIEIDQDFQKLLQRFHGIYFAAAVKGSECLNTMMCVICVDLRHFASSSGGLVVSIDPDTGMVVSQLAVFMIHLLPYSISCN